MELQELKKELPNGAIKEIARRAGLSTTTISQALKGKIKTSKSPEIMKATAEYLTEYRTREREAMQALKRALKTKNLHGI